MGINLAHIKNKFILQEVSNAPLVIFRILFGAMMIISTLRFILNGWVQEFYINPTFHFTFYGFDWIRPLPESWMYLPFVITILASLGIMVGLLYRVSTILFFLSFTYVELLDKTYYLNHYYFVSLIAFLLIWLPAHRRFSLDSYFLITNRATRCQIFEINVIRSMAGIVYCYAGLAKLNTEWLFRAMPLKIWLPANSHLPVIGSLLTKTWVAYLFSWFGAFYDLTISFFLSLKKFSRYGFIVVIVFHITTGILFPIGVFPYLMIFSSIIFFPAVSQEKWLYFVENRVGIRHFEKVIHTNHKWKIALFGLFISFQLIFPWRYTLYPGNLFWTEEGYRFSWRVMLMEKTGVAYFFVTDPSTNKRIMVNNSDHLTELQERMMATQPDMLLQYAHFLDETYQDKGIEDPLIKVEAFVTLNGENSKQFIDSSTDLSVEKDSWAPKKWIVSNE
ncbi:MAG: HTTM domain-containing protein [Bacteroidota bacterium]